MKKYLCIAMCVLTLLMTGCSPKERLIDINLQQMQEKMKNKETFVLVFTQPECGYCKAFKTMLDTYLPDHYVKDGKIVDHFDIDKNDLSKEEDFNAWVDKYELNKDIDYSKETK